MTTTTEKSGTEKSCCAPTCCAPETSAEPARDGDAVRKTIKEQYGRAVTAAVKGAKPSCCGSSTTSTLDWTDPITRDLYGADEARAVPADALAASFGCGNPTALAELRAGEIVLDLGSGGGIDVLLSAKRVGPTGKAYGLDMTDEMLEVAMKNKEKAGAKNVEFLKGQIEEIPLPAKAVDVVISNCVINLSTDKDRVLAEAFRVLKPGGRFAVSDIVIDRDVPEPIKQSIAMWTGCVAGALSTREYVAKLEAAGFTDIELEPTRVYTKEDARDMAGALADEPAVAAVIDELEGAVKSVFVRAKKP